MLIREYYPCDLGALFDFDGHPSTRRLQKLKTLECVPSWFCYVADDYGELLGLVIMEDLSDGASYYMQQINVKDKRKGIGTALVKAVFERIGPGAHISLCVNTDNEVAIKFYEDLGFKRSGFTEGYRKGQNKFWYQIDL